MWGRGRQLAAAHDRPLLARHGRAKCTILRPAGWSWGRRRRRQTTSPVQAERARALLLLLLLLLHTGHRHVLLLLLELPQSIGARHWSLISGAGRAHRAG